MIKRAIFNDSLKKAKSLLKKYELCMHFNVRVTSTPQSFTTLSHKKDYLNIYKTAVDNHIYDAVFKDNSLLQFDYNDTQEHKSLRYAYYQSPYEFPDYESYLLRNDLSFDEVGETFREIYEQEYDEAQINANTSMIRYDYDESLYQEGIHPASHFHVGNSNQIRIPTSIIVTPYLFVLFITKQMYYQKWKELTTNRTFKNHISRSRASCKLLDRSLFTTEDKNELYLI